MNLAAPLQDRFGRRIDYLRLSLTDRCDLRCSYCRPREFDGYAEPDTWLTFDEIERVVAVFARMGAGRIRLTGGEPLLRRGLADLVRRLAVLPGVRDLSLSTNATQLAKHAKTLKAAGLARINVSLDSLDRACVRGIVGRDSLDAIMAGIMAGKDAGLSPIKLNMVAMRDVNDHEIERMAAFCLDHGFILRLIEAMPIGEAGRNAAYLPLDEVRPRLIERFDLKPSTAELGGGPARYWETADGRGRVGFITPVSQHFCATCNRVRLSVDGTLYLCLGQEERVELRPLLRAGIDEAELEAAIRAAIELKPHSHDFATAPQKIARFMSQTGG
ncbi:MAG: GTP 3',8-cyclase MoaA [Paludibacterium sp.]|uniref:GTP 3',8-cyclase MoaA n=1 Tax=Paludibacterium sp. TaxID=1917523 RepID=UPI0025F167EA|nr:GTP 3',8-cyclase MoaA [Paludibacterium sp.]MBV8047152.1 GTP 3',8-cyclase MoaA [Paludibacterium sp.]MBV8647409.1 GTP 3',8-cyclase MoaA [Paludibacterium sp.]